MLISSQETRAYIKIVKYPLVSEVTKKIDTKDAGQLTIRSSIELRKI